VSFASLHLALNRTLCTPARWPRDTVRFSLLRTRWVLIALASLSTTLIASTAALCLTTGCSSVAYYAQSITGHMKLVGAAKPVPQWLVDENSPAALKERLALSQRLRDFAITDLKLPDNASYRRYADLQRSAAVWNVVATPELSLQLKTWCFPVMGCVGYRGYYHEEEAQAYAAQLRKEGLEVLVYGVPAYSTLGKLPGTYFADPLLSTFIRYPEGELARMIFHELSHQVVYADNDTVFNESFATAVERIGSKQWLARFASPQVAAEQIQRDARRDDFRELTMLYRDKLDELFRSAKSDEEKRAGKVQLMAQMRADYAQLKQDRWGGFSGYDGWFEKANNASLGVLAVYNQLVPDFERLFEREGQNFEQFYASVKRLALLPPLERRQQLQAP
jgi:predicted aminopeptidase